MIARKPMVLILGTGNSCRSQMAEGFFRRVRDEIGRAMREWEPAACGR